MRWIALARIGEGSDQEGGFTLGELSRRLLEVMLSRRLGPIDSRPHLNAVKVNLHNAPLGPQPFDGQGEINLQALAQIIPGWPQKNIFGGLLRDGRSSKLLFLSALIPSIGLLNRVQVKAVMAHEVLVFGGNGSLDQMRGNLFHRYPIPVPTMDLARLRLLQQTQNHERGQWDRNPTVEKGKSQGTQPQDQQESKNFPQHAPKLSLLASGSKQTLRLCCFSK